MNRLYITIIALILANSSFCHPFYIKANTNFHIPTSKGNSPLLFEFPIPIPSYTGISSFPVNYSSDNFSIASGVSIETALGYKFNNIISFELNTSYYKNIKSNFQSNSTQFTSSKSRWNYTSISILPTVLFHKEYRKSIFSIFINAGISINSLSAKASFENSYLEYKMNTGHSFSYGYGLQYDYNINNKMALFSKIAMSNTKFSPKSASLSDQSPDFSNKYSVPSEISYSEQSPIQGTNSYYNVSEQRIKQSIQINSVYISLGFKYYFLKENEK